MEPLFDLDEQPLWLTIVQPSTLVLISLAILISAALNLRTLVRRCPTGRIKLHDSAPPPLSTKDRFFALLTSNIEDRGNKSGEDVDVPEFWSSVLHNVPDSDAQVNPRRWIFFIFVLTSASLKGYQDYLTLLASPGRWQLGQGIIESVVCAYLALLTPCYLSTKEVSRHRALTFHLFLISLCLTIHFYFHTIGQYLSFTSHPHITPWQYASLLTSFLSTITVGTIPLAPVQREDLRKLYTRAVASALDKRPPTEGPNVACEFSSSILKFFSANWSLATIIKASQVDQVDIQDLPAPHAHLRSQNTLRDVLAGQDPGITRSKFGPLTGLLWTVWGPQWKAVCAEFALSLTLVPMWYVPHVALQNVLWSLDNAAPKQSAIAWAGMLVLGRIATLVVTLLQLNVSGSYIEPRVRTHSSFLLYRKLMTRNTYASPAVQKGNEKTATTKADILNLISSDVNELGEIVFTVLGMFRSQLEMLLGCIYIWFLLGLWGLSTILLTGIPTYFATKIEYKIFEKKLEIKDKKISLMQEAIQAISMIKMMAAERFWFRRIKSVRDEEFAKLVQARLVGAVSGFLYAATPTIVIVVAFAHYTLVAKKDLTATIAFTSIAVFTELRPVLMELPEKIATLLQQILSAKRIGNFIRARDVDYLEDEKSSSSAQDPTAPLFIKGNVAWDVQATDAANPVFQLQDLDVEFLRGQMTLIAGKFGSGKSLLLLALLGEVRLLDVDISYVRSEVLLPGAGGDDWSLVPSGVAYVPQTAWLQSLSIRDNILFGLPMNMARYKAVLHACALMPDFEILEDADLTEIGERGKILSGGQKARVSLARAVYSRAGTLLLDDVISAVDAQTSQHIIKYCFNGPLMAGRTVLLASHAVEALAPLADRAIFLEGGRVTWQGSGPELLQSIHMAHLKTEPAPFAEEELPLDARARRESLRGGGGFMIKEAIPKTPRQLIMEENRAKGAVDLKHWWDLLRFCGGTVFWSAMIVLLVMVSVAPVAQRRVLEEWTRDSSQHGGQAGGHRVVSWVVLYSVLSILTNVLGSSVSLFRFWGSLRATKRIHAEMLESMLRAKMAFFTKTRAGSIVERFGKDLNDVQNCSESVGSLVSNIAGVLVSLVSISAVGGWGFALVALCLLMALYKPSKWYRSSGRQIRRLQSVIPGTINAIYGETVAGVAVIRAFGVQSLFVHELLGALNMRINAAMWRVYIARWLFVNLRFFDFIIISTALAIILQTPGMTGGTAGFILAFAGTITGEINWLLINARQIELQGVSLERTSEYRALEREEGEPLNVDSKKEPIAREFHDSVGTALSAWPSSGEIRVKELSARYGKDLPDILHKVSFHVAGGQRVGIVGATGGGKSTLAKAFFSFVEISHGGIEIDGKDIADIPLGLVRSRLGIIAQDPILLSGSLRLNLDIDGQFTDEQLYDALHQVQLIKRTSSPSTPAITLIDVDDASSNSSATIVGEEGGKAKDGEGNANIFTNLDYEIKSGGENLSAGQKQLVVLARALLKRHKVLILDEATASIDSATDAEISRVVHEEFTDATVLIIAHRLRTIMPCGKILVMDQGRLVQQGTPAELIKVEGKFQSLCMAAGIEEYRHLVSLAEQAACSLI